MKAKLCDLEIVQREICEKFDAKYVACEASLKIGVSKNIRSGELPLNGLRYSPTGDTTGWYLWAGEHLSDAPDFFMPLHASHIDEWCPALSNYLGLAPGWRFLVAGDHVDVWFDETLLSD